MSKLLAQANPFGNTGLQPSDAAFQINRVNADTARAETLTNFEAIVSQVLGILTTVGSVFFIIYFVIAAFKWITAGGDSGKIQKARDQMVQGVLGLIIMVAAYGIIGLVGRIIGLDILQPAASFNNLLNIRP